MAKWDTIGTDALHRHVPVHNVTQESFARSARRKGQTESAWEESESQAIE